MATNQDFLRVLRSEDTDSTSVIAWIETNRFDINADFGDGRTALYQFVEERNERVVRILLEAGAKVEGLTADALDMSEPTALSAAINVRSANIALLLLGKGANPNLTNQDDYRDTSLHQAAEALYMPGITNVINEMLIRGADITARNSNGYTPFQVACLEGNIEAITIIMGFYPHININDHGGVSALSAFQYSQPSLYAQLAGFVSVNTTEEQVMAGVDGLSITPINHENMDSSS